MNVLELAEQYGRYKKVTTAKGGEYHGPCPLCGGNDRFHIWPAQKETGTYWCRQCEIEGDLIQFLMDVEKLSFREACRRAGRDLPAQQEGRTPQVKRPAGDNWQPTSTTDPAQLWQEHAEKFVTACHERLLEEGNEEGTPLHYLASRGISRESAVKFRLGWNAGEKGKDSYRAREAWGLETILKDDGKKKKLWLPVGVVIPCYREGALRRLRIRIPNERRTPEFSTPYYVVPGSSPDTFVTRPDAKAWFITEAELDAILVDQEAQGFSNVGAMALGNNSARPTERAHRLLERSLHIANALDYDPGVGKNGQY
jgi:DNA primase